MIRFIILIVSVILLFVSNLFFGAVHISANDVMSALFGRMQNDALRFIIVDSRLPQAFTALFAGGGLAVSGLLMQTIFRNPLAGPSILGISSGASLGVAVVMLFMGGTLSVGYMSWGGYAATVVGALIGSLLIMGILIMLSSIVKSDLLLLIIGILIGYLTSSIVTLLSSISTAQGVQGYVMWGMGSFGDVSMKQLPIFSILVLLCMVGTFFLAKPLNILLLGDNYAINLGINVRKIRNILLLATGILTAIITAYCGPLAFIGMAVPHIARMIFKTDNHWILIPASMLCGSMLCLGCNVVSAIPENTVIPINALTPVVGVPVILYVILGRKR
ncbi:iron ABC transporter permease [Lepagella muris]|uniref:Iron ABC transporter permease n=1 Tax=Lepagella muris TaxID=3032870 RepID=A0AC61RIY5_9BACT|nr:iron ABC transporter permease [Lepagella muris]ROT08454.1 iron ABC transporter permease [Muribaculaceae bacterium Isolate-037 (Harlan)]TGY79692.1 iron ABC transporter permease [Lepagella muris]THG51238.1 iron ABC transporter permease [Bacteroidales bacterium]TKC54841.1 iron ABC transporter permease [Bacteroidales bacterium]